VGDAKAAPAAGLVPVSAALSAHKLLDAILVHPPDARRPSGSESWLANLPASRLFHVREGSTTGMNRLARVYAGRSMGLVLSGGGARAYAHAGVVRALRELGAPIDFVAGNSMGAIVAAGVAMGWNNAEMDARLHEAFVASSPLNDIAFPVLAMTHGREVEARLARHFGETEIGDLWRPFACVSTDLTAGAVHVHRRGKLREALRASLSLPGVLPPVVMDGHVLVDGAMVDNLPVDLVKAWHDGPTIGVDVGHAEGLRPEDLELQPSPAAWLTSGAWKHGPPIVSVLIRSATVGPEAAALATHAAFDLVITPQVDAVGLQDWKAYAPAVDAGYRATLAQAEAIAALTAGRRDAKNAAGG
jgi:NTE family protein